MQTVLSAEQARKVTGGRKPLVPVEYESAVNALQACMTIDDSKYWADKADALAAWAKIYRDDEAGRKARQLKLLAFRRMGEIASELRRAKPLRKVGKDGRNKFYGTTKGGRSALIDAGLKPDAAANALHIAKMDDANFRRAVDSPRPPGVSSLAHQQRSVSHSEPYRRLIYGMGAGGILSQLVWYCAKNDARALAKTVLPDESPRLTESITGVVEWLDEFMRCMPKSRK